jgi:hypothetical protein
MVVGCGDNVPSSEEDSIINQIEKWSYENLEQSENFTVINDTIMLMLDEDGNELSKLESLGEKIVFYDPYKTKLNMLSEDDHQTEPYYELHQNGEIITYYGKKLASETTKEEYQDPEIFETLYIGEGEHRPGLLLGMVEYEVIEDNDEQVIIKAIIDPEEVYGAYAEYLHIKSWNKTIYFNKGSQKVEKVEEHQIVNAEELLQNLEIEGNLVKENDVTTVSEYRNINSSQDFDLPEGR